METAVFWLSYAPTASDYADAWERFEALLDSIFES